MIRAFLAIEISDEVRAAIGDAQGRLKRARLGIKVSWVKIGNTHLTLQFLGHVDEAALDRIRQSLGEVAGQHPSFSVAVRGVGTFPSPHRPRVVWVGIEDPEGRLGRLAAALQTSMGALGFEPERRQFSPHLTLGRIKFPQPDSALTHALDSLKNIRFGTLGVEAIHLFQSELHPAGSIYTKLSTHALSGAA